MLVSVGFDFVGYIGVILLIVIYVYYFGNVVILIG